MGIISQFTPIPSKAGRGRRHNRSALIAAVRCAMEPLESRIFLSVTNAWKLAVSGDFDNPAMWSLGHVPTSTEDAVINVAGSYSITHNTSAADSINSLLSTQAFSLSAGALNVSSTVEVDNSFTLNGGTLSSATVLPGSAGQGLTATSGTLDGVTFNSNLQINGAVTVKDGLTVNGTASLGDAAGTVYGYLLFQGPQTLGGSGSVVFGGSIDNSLLANDSNSALTIGSGLTVTGKAGYIGFSPFLGGSGAASIINKGTMQWANGGNLNIPGTLTNNGAITVDGTSTFAPGDTVLGGTITTQTGAKINNVTLDGVTVSGDWQAGTGGVTIKHGLTLGGTLSLGDAAATTYGFLSFQGAQTLGGSGSVVFGGSNDNSLLSNDSNSALTIGSGITVTGKNGYIGFSPFLGGSAAASIINKGSIQWVNGGNLNILGTLTGSGTITVDGTSTFSPGGTILGGTITTQTGAKVNGVILDGVMVSGDWQAGTSGVTIKNGLTLGGTLSLGDAAATTYGFLAFQGAQTLGGTGSVVFGGSNDNSLLSNDSSSTLTIGSGITVNGKNGYIGFSPFLGGSSAAQVINNGIMQWVNGGNLNIPGTLTNNGAITVDGTSTFAPGGTVLGGTITTQTGAKVNGVTLDGVTVSGDWQAGTSGVTVKHGLTLGGTLSLGDAAGTTYGFLNFQGAQTLGGTGSVVFGGSNDNSLLANDSNSALTIGSGITVNGKNGYIGSSPFLGGSGAAGIINQGTIQTNVSGGMIGVNTPNGLLANSGLLGATSGTLSVSSGGLTNTGTVAVAPTSTINVSGNFTQSAAGNLNIALGGSTPDLYGHVTVSGTASLDGTLNISEANGFSPGTGNIFTILTYASATGQFANYTGLSLPGGAALQPAVSPTSVTLTTVTSTTIAPDLRVTNLTTSPGSPQSGQNLTINWSDFNAGNGSTGASWTDHVVVTDTTTNQVLASADVPYNAAVSGSLPSNGSSTRSYTFRLPDGSTGVGNLHIVVSADYFNTIAEFYPGNVGESNNTSTLNVSASLASYPDLAPSSVTAPPSILPGQSMNVSWTLSNSGATIASGPWTEQVFLATDVAGDNPTLVGAVNYAGPRCRRRPRR
jgi:fibronectin-binding autotransporter adhesin